MGKKRKSSNSATDRRARIASTSVAEAAPILSTAECAPNDAVNLNFRVSADFRRNFRLYAVAHDLKLNELLPLAFEALKKATP